MILITFVIFYFVYTDNIRYLCFLISIQNSKFMSKKKKYYLDILSAIKYHDERNPDNKILTQARLAEMTNRSRQALVNYQNGRGVPDMINFIEDVERITGFNKDQLIKIKE